jgi:tetratricopeptide (TPR) repeat protein
VFYAGHGYLNEKTGEAYWIPVDAQGMDETNYIRHETVKEKLSIVADNASHVLLVSDSCFSGKLVRDTRGRGIYFQPDQPGYYSKKAKLKSIQVISAGGTEFVDDNFRSTGHSPFTYFFLNELENNGKQYLAVSEFITNVEKNVANSVRQTPVLGRLYGAGDESGEFIFTQKNLSRADIEREIEQLLKSAENYFVQGDLIDPPLNNARKSWVEVQRLDPSNHVSKQGLTRIADYYVTKTREHIEQKRFPEARKTLQIAADVKPDYSEIGLAQEELDKAENYVEPPILPW